MTPRPEVAAVMAAIAEWQRAADKFSGPESPEVTDWRRRLARVAKEARARKRAKDWDWFWWLDEFSRMRAATIFEDFEKYSATITAGAEQSRRQRKLREASAAKRKTTLAEQKSRLQRGEKVALGDRQKRRIRNS